MNEALKIIISAEIGELKSSVSEAQDAVSDFASETQNAQSTSDSAFGGMSAAAAAKFALIESAVTGAIDKIKEMISTATSYGDTIDKQSQKMQMSAQAYQEWSYVLQRNGTDISSLKRGINNITADLGAMATGAEVDTSAYDALGVSLRNADGSMKSSESVMTDCIMALADMDDVTQRNALAQELFGRGFTELLPLLNTSSSDIQDLIAVADEYAVISDEDVAASANMADAQLTLQSAFQQVSSEVAANLMPIISEVFGVISEIFIFLGEHQTLLTTLVVIIGTLAAAFTAYHAVMLVVNTVQGIYAGVQAAVNAVMMACPAVWIVAAIMAVIAVIVLCITHWEQIKEVIANVWDSICKFIGNAVETIKGIFEKLWSIIQEIFNKIKEFFATVWGAIKNTVVNIVTGIKDTISNIFNTIKSTISNIINGIKSGIDTVFNGIKNTITTVVNAIKSTVTSVFNAIKTAIMTPVETAINFVKNMIDKLKSVFNFSWSLPKLKMPHVNISGEFSLAPPKVPHFSIDWYARGGVFDSTTLFTAGGRLGGLGEDGAEAVVPLEKNLEWLDVMAGMLAAKMGSTQPIVLEVDGKTFAEITVNSINDLTRQRGAIPLKLV